MDTTLSMVTPLEAKALTGAAELPSESDPCGQTASHPSKAKIVFNPYIEVSPEVAGDVFNAPLSNCMNCHKRAVYRRFSQPVESTAFRGELRSDADCFGHNIRLDYLWSLVPVDPQSPVGAFYQQVIDSLDKDDRLSRYETR